MDRNPVPSVPPTNPTPADIRTRIAQALDALGHSADEVADRLRALGIKGVRKHECACPVAVYLSATAGKSMVFEVAAGFTRAFSSGEFCAEVPVPAPVVNFICRFDSGVYLDLVDAPAVTR